MRIGNAPCSWGIEFADDPRNPTWQSVLDECSTAGFDGIDLGPVGFFPEDVSIFSDALDKSNLSLASGVVFRPFHDPTGADEYIEATHRTCKTLVAHGGKELTLIDSIASERTTTLGRPDMAPQLDSSQWQGLVSRISQSASIAVEEYGLTASLHAHAGGYCDFEDEHDRLLSEIDESILSVCIDTAHLSLAGMDPFAITRRYKDRVRHIHLKDINMSKRKEVVEQGIQFYDACADDLFCQIGDGAIDFGAFKVLLDEIGYDGWCIVEQDCAPDVATSKVEIARSNREHLQSVGY